MVHDIRSTHNVGAIMRTAECLGVKKIIFSGYTPYPIANKDQRLPHIAKKIHQQIQKTALGAETLVPWEYTLDVAEAISLLKKAGYRITALEQNEKSLILNEYEAPDKIALLLGREVEGIDSKILSLCDDVVEIRQYGKKESLNVVQACAIALYALQES